METSAIAQLMQPPALDTCRSVLCVAPHPDDNEIGMGGVIAQMTAAGVHVDYLTVTDGALGDLGLHDSELDLAHVRKTEAIAAGQLLGVRDFYWLDLPDGTLRDVPALARAIAERLRQGGYDAVFCPDPWNAYEAHMDHVVVGRATAQAAISCNLRAYPEGTHTAPCNLQAVGFYFTGKPNTVVDITGYFAQKMQAIAAHQSQISPEMLQLYTGYFAFRGQRLTQSEAIGEGLKVLAPLLLHCIPEAADI